VKNPGKEKENNLFGKNLFANCSHSNALTLFPEAICDTSEFSSRRFWMHVFDISCIYYKVLSKRITLDFNAGL